MIDLCDPLNDEFLLVLEDYIKHTLFKPYYYESAKIGCECNAKSTSCYDDAQPHPCPFFKYQRKIASQINQVDVNTLLLAVEYIRRLQLTTRVDVDDRSINRLFCSACWVALYTQNNLPNVRQYLRICSISRTEMLQNTTYMLQNLKHCMITDCDTELAKLASSLTAFWQEDDGSLPKDASNAIVHRNSDDTPVCSSASHSVCPLDVP
jgi:hypothetical protein